MGMYKQTDPRPIGFFDSGVGGLTVMKEAMRQLPHESFIYIGHTLYVPFGDKSPEVIKKLSLDVARVLLQKNIKALVIACNTATAMALEDVQQLAGEIPVIGVIDPTVRCAVDVTPENATIAVIATNATIKSNIYQRKIREYRKEGVSVIAKATPLFVHLIEEQPHDHPLMQKTIELYLQEIKDNPNVLTLILGCTHYPMIKDQIQTFLGERIKIVDSAHPTVEALKVFLLENHMEHGRTSPTMVFFTSDNPRQSMAIAREFLGGDLDLQQITIP